MSEQAVLVLIPSTVPDDFELDTIEDLLSAAVTEGGLGEFDGNEIGRGGATLFIYGPSADALFQVVAPLLQNLSLPPATQSSGGTARRAQRRCTST